MSFPFRPLILLLASALFAPLAHAQSIGIMPFERTTPASRLGATITNDIEIYNNGSVPIQVSTEVKDWSLSPTGQKIYAPIGTLPSSLGAHLRLNPTVFSVPPRKSQRVRYSISVPADMMGELRAMIFFTTRPLPVAEKGVSLNIATRLGCSLFLTPPKSIFSNAPQPKISEIKIVGDVPQVVVKVENAGLSSTRLSGAIEARNAANVVIARGTLPRTQLLSGGQREITARWQTALPPGDYTFKATLDSGKGSRVAGELRATLATKIKATPIPTSKTTK